jgi:hypothetical protein
VVVVPPEVPTVMGPLLAPAGTVALMAVSELTLNVAAVPLKLTVLAPVKPDPVMVTVVPTAPLTGVNALTDGAGGCGG